MKKTRICILYGGKSGEHEISLRSAASIVENLDKERYEIIPIGIDKDGKWHLQDNVFIENKSGDGKCLALKKTDRSVMILPEEGLFTGDKKLDIDIVFPILHGSYGEDGTVQGLLEIADIPYIGSGVLGSSLSMDKEKTKRIWREIGLPVVDFEVLHRGEEKHFLDTGLRRIGFPMFVKPARTGSSLGISKVEKTADLQNALNNALQYDNKVLIEKAISGREIECSIIGNREPVSFPPGEIVSSHGFYDYDAKYTDPNGAKLLIPAPLSETLSTKIQLIAKEAYRAVEAEGFSRVDFFIEKGTDRIFINEINTIPGFTSISMFPKLCEAGGLAYPEILETLVKLAMERYRDKEKLRYRYK